MAYKRAKDASAEPSGFRLYCRGEVRLYCGDEDCTPKSKKGRALLAVLAAEQRHLSRIKIIDLLWSDRQEEQARASLRTLLADLKEQFNSRFEGLLVVDRERVGLGPGVRTDLTDPSLARPAGELFEGLDHIDPELDEWLRLERQNWAAAGNSSPLADARTAVRPPIRNPPTTARLALSLVAALIALAVLVLTSSVGTATEDSRVKVDEALALLAQSSPRSAEEARRMLLDIVEETPNSPVALGALAEATMAASDHPSIGGRVPLAVARREAMAYSRRAIKLAPDKASSWAALGFSQFGTSAAVQPLERAVQLDPNRARYRWQLGRALEYQNRYDEAYLHQRRAIELDPRSPEPLIGFLRAAVQLDRLKEMKAEVVAYRRRNPNSRDSAYVTGYYAHQLGDEPGCIKYLEPLVSAGDYRPLYVLVLCLTALGEKSRAAELSAGMPSFRLDILEEDAAAVERHAKTMGREFWLRNIESMAATDLLLKAGKAQALVRSFDASYESVAEFEQEGGRVAREPTAILLAMQILGRAEDARRLRNLLSKQVKDQRDGMGLGTWSLFAKGAVALADGDRDQAVSLLEQCYPDCMLGDFEIDISRSTFFGRLNGHPRFDQLVRRYRRLINDRRRRAGLPPLPVSNKEASGPAAGMNTPVRNHS